MGPGSTDAALRWVAPRIGLVGLALALLWPFPRVWSSEILAAPDQEAAAHIWGLWAALTTGQPLVVDTDLLAWPDGVRLVLVDPVHLPAFGLGSLLGGPIAGYNLVLLAGLLTCAVGGWLLARELGGAPWLGAAAAMCNPALLASAGDGQTENFAVGWVGVHLALLLRFLRQGDRRLGAAAGVALALCWYGGPYNGLFASGAATVTGLAYLWRGRRDRRPRGPTLARLGAVALIGLALASPELYAVIRLRDPSLPGGASFDGLRARSPAPAGWRGGIPDGADLLDPWLPVGLTGGEAAASHTAYLGVVLVGAALLAVARDRARWRWLAGALAFVALGLGPWLSLGGQDVEVAGRDVAGPAGWLILAIPALGRITRWYRAAAVGHLLLAALASTLGTGSRLRALGLVAAMAVDATLLAPLRWPLQSTPAPTVAAYEALPPGAVLELPRRTSGEPPPGQWRDRTALAQTLHGRAVVGTIMGLPEPTGAAGWQSHVETLMRTGRARAEHLADLRRAGLRGLALLVRYRAPPPDAVKNLNKCLGPPVARDDEVWMYDLEGRGPGRAPDGGCGFH